MINIRKLSRCPNAVVISWHPGFQNFRFDTNLRNFRDINHYARRELDVNGNASLMEPGYTRSYRRFWGNL